MTLHLEANAAMSAGDQQREVPTVGGGLIGLDLEVPCLDGHRRRYVNLDYAASTPVMASVWRAVEEFVPWYSSVHRGTGFKSQIATAALEGARETVARFLGSRDGDVVVFVRNTTEALNLLSVVLPEGSHILTTPVEHHANMLPWRRHHVHMLPFTSSPAELLAACEEALSEARPAIDLLAVTGASNVTGEVWPIGALAELAHRFGAELVVDAAQLAGQRPIDMAGLDIDHVAISGHKLYAPFGAGALVSRASRLEGAEPLLRGGGAVKLVTEDDVTWADAPDRYEAGSPNVVGIVALGEACRALGECGMDRVAEHSRALGARLRAGIGEIPGVEVLELWPGDTVDRVGLATFNLEGCRHPLLAAILSAEHAIGVRHGCFCAHPFVTRLLDVSSAESKRIRGELRCGRHGPIPGAVRASTGLGTVPHDLDRLLEALVMTAEAGPGWDYRYDPARDEYEPLADNRDWPDLGVALSRAEGPAAPRRG